MAYSSTLSAPQLIMCGGVGSPSSGVANGGGGNWWRYSSTADAVATVLGSAYFTDGYGRGMRKGDFVMYQDMTSTAWSTNMALLMVTAVTTSSTGGVGGGTATVSQIITTST